MFYHYRSPWAARKAWSEGRQRRPGTIGKTFRIIPFAVFSFFLLQFKTTQRKATKVLFKGSEMYQQVNVSKM